MQKMKWNVLILASALALTLLSAQAAPAAGLAKNDQTGQTAEKAQNAEVYRVHYTISEMESAKTINSRSYSLMAKTSARASTRISSEVGVSVSPSAVQAVRVGMNIDCIVTTQEGNLLVHTEIRMDTITDKGRLASSEGTPLTRLLSLADDAVVTLGKPAFVGSIDDVGSNRRYVIEVTVTKAQ